MKKVNILQELFGVIAISLFVSGCAKNAIPMTKQEVYEITGGKKFKTSHYAYFGNVSYICERADEHYKKMGDTLWEKGAYGSYELYEVNRYSWSRNYFEAKSTSGHISDNLYFFDSRKGCVAFAAPKGSSNSINVYVH